MTVPKNSYSMKLVKFSHFHEADVARRAIMEERQAEIAKQSRFQPVMERIRLHRARGMTEASIVRIYGAEAVNLERESRIPGGGTKTEAVIDSTPPLSALQSNQFNRRAARI